MPDERRGARPPAGRASGPNLPPRPSPQLPSLDAADLPLPSDRRVSASLGRFAPYVEAVSRKLEELRQVELAEEQLIQYHRMSFGALAALTALQAVAPKAVPSLWWAFISQPLIGRMPTNAMHWFWYLMGVVLWLFYAIYHVTQGALLRRTEAGWPYQPLQTAGLALIPLVNVYGTWVLFSQAATRLERETQVHGRAGQVKTATLATLGLIGAWWAVQLAVDLGVSVPEITLNIVLYIRAAAQLAVLGLTFWMMNKLIRRFAEEGGGLDPTSLEEAGIPAPLARGPAAPSGGLTVVTVAVLLVAGIVIYSVCRDPFECPLNSSIATTRDKEGRRVLYCERDGAPNGPWRVRTREGDEQYTFEKGVMIGDYRTWYPNGTLRQTGQYRDQLKQGSWTSYNEKGVKLLEETYSDNVLHGTVSKYHASNGQLAEATVYDHGKPSGRYAAFHENGKKAEEGTYKEGQKVGHWTSWNSQGLVTDERDYTPSATPQAGSPAAAASSDGPGAPAAAQATPEAPEIHVVTEKRFYAGRTPEWWGERLTKLKQQADSGEGSPKVYELTKRRAQQNGLEVQEGPEVTVRIAQGPPVQPQTPPQPAPQGGTP